MSQSTSDLELLLAGLRGDDKEEGGLSEALAALILKKNRENTFRFLITPYAERVVLLPQCLRSTAACQAEERDGEYICKGCGAGLPPIQPETLAAIKTRTVYWMPDSVEVQGPFVIDEVERVEPPT